MDSSVYEVEFEDGAVERHHANIIAEHICSQTDQDGHGRTLMDEIIDHESDGNVVKKGDGISRAKNGAPIPMQTTKGWWMLARLNDHSTQWFKLKDLKESNPLEFACSACKRQSVGRRASFQVVGAIHNQEEEQNHEGHEEETLQDRACLLYTSPSPRDLSTSRMPSSA